MLPILSRKQNTWSCPQNNLFFRNKYSLFAGISKHLFHHCFINYYITTKTILPVDAESNSKSSTIFSSTSTSSTVNPSRKYSNIVLTLLTWFTKRKFSLFRSNIKNVTLDKEIIPNCKIVFDENLFVFFSRIESILTSIGHIWTTTRKNEWFQIQMGSMQSIAQLECFQRQRTNCQSYSRFNWSSRFSLFSISFYRWKFLYH